MHQPLQVDVTPGFKPFTVAAGKFGTIFNVLLIVCVVKFHIGLH